MIILKAVLLVLLAVCAEEGQTQLLPSPQGLHYLGVGYNLLTGNPEGGDLSNGGVDPGLLFTRKILQLTYNDKPPKVSVDRKYLVPDQVVFAPRDSCVNSYKKDTFSGEKSYQSKLAVDVSYSGGFDAVLFKFAFSQSTRFEKVRKETSKLHNVYYEEKSVCNRGRARYQYDLAQKRKFPVSHEFAAAVCALPATYSESAYMGFIERWGTHVVLEAELGKKRVERYQSSLTEFTKYAMTNVDVSVSASGSYKGFSGSLKVDFKRFQESMSSGAKFGENKVIFQSGGDNLPEPIGLKLIPVTEVLNPLYFEALNSQCKPSKPSGSIRPVRPAVLKPVLRFDSLTMSSRLVRECCSLGIRKSYLMRALRDYPKWKGTVLPTDPNLQIPITWPLGTYGLPMTTSGCPKSPSFAWHPGFRYHDTSNWRSSNGWSIPYRMAGYKGTDNMEQRFCMKTQARGTVYDMGWPKGQYCVFKKGACPSGFGVGYIRWDDENHKNKNHFGGSVPDGVYGTDTTIYYCCRSDGYATNQIYLPTDEPFVLFKSDSHQCQMVHGMKVSDQYFDWDTENYLFQKFNKNKASGSRPYASVGKNIHVCYCYYYR